MEIVSQLVCIAVDIYNSLGPGYNEVIYHRAFEVALRLSNIAYESEVVTPVFYKGFNVGHGRVDIKLANIIIELKAINTLNNDAIIQTKNYMNHYSISLGLVVNFGQSKSGLGIILINSGVVHDFVNGNFVARNELTVN
jgi:GxxExxY protein